MAKRGGGMDPVLQRELASAQEEMTTLLALKGEAERDSRWEEAQVGECECRLLTGLCWGPIAAPLFYSTRLDF